MAGIEMVGDDDGHQGGQSQEQWENQNLKLELEATQNLSDDKFEPLTQATMKQDFRIEKSEEEDEGDSDECHENEEDRLWYRVGLKEERKEDLKREVDVLTKEVGKAEETKWARIVRVEGKKSQIVKQEAELYRQQEDLKIEKQFKKEEDNTTTKDIDEKIKFMEEKVEVIGNNILRVSKGKAIAGKVNLKTETLTKINRSEKEIFVFYPGVNIVEALPKRIKEEIKKVKSLKVICSEEMKKIATEIKEIGDKKAEIGICFLKWKEVARAEDIDSLKREETKLLSALKLVTSRGKEKFDSFFVVIPTLTGDNREQLQNLSGKIKETYNYDGNIEIVDVESKVDDEWKKMAGGEDEAEENYERYFFCRILSEVASIISGKDEIGLASVCEECGLEHGEECILQE